MSAKTRFFSKIAIRTGSIFALAMGAIIFFTMTAALPVEKAILFGLGFGLLAGLLFGLLFAFVITIAQVAGLKKIGETEFTDETLAVIQLKTIQTKKSFDDVISILEKSDKFNQVKIVTSQKKMEITGSLSLKSWGEHIEITLTQSQDNLNTFELLSRPSVRTTMADYGKNRQNVLQLERILLEKDDLSEHLVD